MAYTGNLQVVRSSGAMLAANQKPDIDTVLRVLEPYQTPILQYMFFSGSFFRVKQANQLEIKRVNLIGLKTNYSRTRLQF